MVAHDEDFFAHLTPDNTVLVIVTDLLRGGKDVILGHTEQLEMRNFPKQMNEASEMRLQLTSLAEALGELYGLLEGYAPTWYTCITIYSDDAVNTLSSLKFIADAGNGEDQLRFFGSLLQFLA